MSKCSEWCVFCLCKDMMQSQCSYNFLAVVFFSSLLKVTNRQSVVYHTRPWSRGSVYVIWWTKPFPRFTGRSCHSEYTCDCFSFTSEKTFSFYLYIIYIESVAVIYYSVCWAPYTQFFNALKMWSWKERKLMKKGVKDFRFVTFRAQGSINSFSKNFFF